MQFDEDGDNPCLQNVIDLLRIGCLLKEGKPISSSCFEKGRANR